jgi:hypothetical protein
MKIPPVIRSSIFITAGRRSNSTSGRVAEINRMNQMVAVLTTSAVSSPGVIVNTVAANV